jgi:hypothetical protein
MIGLGGFIGAICNDFDKTYLNGNGFHTICWLIGGRWGMIVNAPW